MLMSQLWQRTDNGRNVKIELFWNRIRNWMKLTLGPNFTLTTLFLTLVSGLGMSTNMRRRTQMVGAATPGWEIYLTSCHPGFWWARLSKMHLFFIDFQVSYLVVISPSGETVFSGVFGDKEGNNAGMWRQIRQIEVCNSCFENFKMNNNLIALFTGEYLTVMRNGDLMINTDSDTVPGAGFLKLTKTYW